VDLRHGFDRLAQTARERIGADPLHGGALFFRVRQQARDAHQGAVVRAQRLLLAEQPFPDDLPRVDVDIVPVEVSVR
jgi:hypothetical protein